MEERAYFGLWFQRESPSWSERYGSRQKQNFLLLGPYIWLPRKVPPADPLGYYIKTVNDYRTRDLFWHEIVIVIWESDLFNNYHVWINIYPFLQSTYVPCWDKFTAIYFIELDTLVCVDTCILTLKVYNSISLRTFPSVVFPSNNLLALKSKLLTR